MIDCYVAIVACVAVAALASPPPFLISAERLRISKYINEGVDDAQLDTLKIPLTSHGQRCSIVLPAFSNLAILVAVIL